VFHVTFKQPEEYLCLIYPALNILHNSLDQKRNSFIFSVKQEDKTPSDSSVNFMWYD